MDHGDLGDPSADGVDAVLARLFDPSRRDTVLPWLRLRALNAPAITTALQRYDREVGAQYAGALRAVADRIGLGDDVDVEAAVEVVRALAENFQLRLASDTLTVDTERFVATVVDAITRAWLGQASSRTDTAAPSTKETISSGTRRRSSAR